MSVTRYYYDLVNPNVVVPPSSVWARFGTGRGRLITARPTVTVNGGTGPNESVTTATTTGILQAIGAPLAAGGRLSGTARAAWMVSESINTADAYLRILVRVVSGDGTTVRGVLFDSVDTVEINTINSSRSVAGALTPVVALAGDRLVLEVGANLINTSSLAAGVSAAGYAPAYPDAAFDTDSWTTASASWLEIALDEPPLPPTALAAAPTITTAVLTWAPPASGAAPTGYTVSLDGAAPVAVGNVTTLTLTGLAPGSTHTATVRTVATTGTSAPASVTFTTLDPPPPGLVGVRLEVGPVGAALDVLGDSYTLKIRRGNASRGVTDALEAGTLLAVVDGPTANPLTVARIRTGTPVRVLAGISDGLGATVWEALFTGTLDRARLVYDGGASKADPDAYRATLTASDVVGPLSAAPAETAVGGTLTQRVAHVLDPTGLPWHATDTDAPLPTPALDTNERTAAGGLRLAVDTLHGLAYVDRHGVIQVVADNTRPRAATTGDYLATDDPTAPAAALHYYDVAPSLDTDALVNVLEVGLLADGDTTPSTYVDEDSRATWGPHRGEVTVNDGVPETHAGLWLASRRDPALLPEALDLNVRARPSHLTAAATLEPYDTVTVVRAGVLPAPGVTLAVRDLEHTLTANRRQDDGIGWLLHIGLRPLETLATRWKDVPAALRWADVPPGLTWRDAVRWHPYL